MIHSGDVGITEESSHLCLFTGGSFGNGGAEKLAGFGYFGEGQE